MVALLGHPVSESLSPQMQNAAFDERGLDWAYVACDVAPEQFETAVSGLGAAGLAGANVTTPHKEAAAALAETDLSSVNTLVFEKGRIVGHSTDAAVLDGLTAERPVVLGAGGAALAFRAALPEARVFARSGAWPPEIADADLIVNATSERNDVLVQAGEGQTLVDLPYPETASGPWKWAVRSITPSRWSFPNCWRRSKLFCKASRQRHRRKERGRPPARGSVGPRAAVLRNRPPACPLRAGRRSRPGRGSRSSSPPQDLRHRGP